MTGRKLNVKEGRINQKIENETNLTEINKKLDQILANEERRTMEAEEMRNLIKLMRDEIQRKDNIIRQLQNELEDTQQYQRINNLIIDGIPQSENDDTSQIVIKT